MGIQLFIATYGIIGRLDAGGGLVLNDVNLGKAGVATRGDEKIEPGDGDGDDHAPGDDVASLPEGWADMRLILLRIGVRNGPGRGIGQRVGRKIRNNRSSHKWT